VCSNFLRFDFALAPTRILDQRVTDGVIRRMIDKWLNAGVLEAGNLHFATDGTPQGGVISPMLSNIFLHHVLDKWFEDVVRPRMKGKATLVRFADDFVMTFETVSRQFRAELHAVIPLPRQLFKSRRDLGRQRLPEVARLSGISRLQLLEKELPRFIRVAAREGRREPQPARAGRGVDTAAWGDGNRARARERDGTVAGTRSAADHRRKKFCARCAGARAVRTAGVRGVDRRG
jgi:Reverse transcriptase (RNA-dependent DNA polymerase)